MLAGSVVSPLKLIVPLPPAGAIAGAQLHRQPAGCRCGAVTAGNVVLIR